MSTTVKHPVRRHIAQTALQLLHALIGKTHAGVTKEDISNMIDISLDAAHIFHQKTGTLEHPDTGDIQMAGMDPHNPETEKSAGKR